MICLPTPIQNIWLKGMDIYDFLEILKYDHWSNFFLKQNVLNLGIWLTLKKKLKKKKFVFKCVWKSKLLLSKDNWIFLVKGKFQSRAPRGDSELLDSLICVTRTNFPFNLNATPLLRHNYKQPRHSLIDSFFSSRSS